MTAFAQRFARVLGLAAIVLLFKAGTCGAAQSDLLSFHGDVQVQKASEPGQWKPAAKGMKLDENDLIKTGLKSDATISVGKSKNKMTLQPASSMAMSSSEQNWICKLGFGRIRCFLNHKLAKPLEVHTPIAVAAVRGTVFEVSYDEASKTGLLTVKEGKVALTKGGVEVLVRAGSQVEF